jgi:predicted MFS family arabinose efflux permease
VIVNTPTPELESHAASAPPVSLVKVLFVLEASLYAAVTPVLPHYARELGASKAAVGVLAAGYAGGLVPGSLLGGWMAARAGVRRTTLVGLVVFACAVVPFGFAANIAALDLLRVAQGVGCGFIWGGALTWVIATTQRSRRGEVLGSVIGAAVFGTLLGPMLGTLAVAVGTKPVFTAVGLLALALSAWVLSHDDPGHPSPGPRTPIAKLLRSRALTLAVWLVMLEASTMGATNALVPLRMSRLGASGVAIGATFLLAAGLRSLLAPFAGRFSDRREATLPIVLGLLAAAPLMVLMPLPHSAWGLALLTTIALGGPLTAYLIPAVSLLTESAEQLGVALSVATTLFNLAYAIGETVGAPAAADLAQITSDAIPFLVVAALMVLTIPVVSAQRSASRRPRGRTSR